MGTAHRRGGDAPPRRRRSPRPPRGGDRSVDRVRQYPKVPATSRTGAGLVSRGPGRLRRCIDRSGAVAPRSTILHGLAVSVGEVGVLEGVECVDGTAVDIPRASAPGDGPGFPNRLGEGGQLLILGRRRGETALAAQHLPTPRDGDPAGVVLAEVPGVRLLRRRERTDHRGRLGVDEGQGSHRGSGAAGSAAQSGKLHVTRLALVARNHLDDTLTARAPAKTRAAGGDRGSPDLLHSRHAYRPEADSTWLLRPAGVPPRPAAGGASS